MAIGNTNASSGSGSARFKWVLEDKFNPEETYYERRIQATNPSVIEGTYILIDKTNIAPVRTSSYNTIYGDYDIIYGAGTICFRLEQRRDTGGGATGPFWNCYGFNVKNSTTTILVYFRTDSGSSNSNDAVHTYSTMPEVIMNSNYDGEYNRSLISVFDSSVVKNLMNFLNSASVKVSDKIMGVDYNTREELLSQEGYSSITDWVESLTSYNKIDLSSSSFVSNKYFKKVYLEV